ncbi:protein involved in gliding motility GldC [Dokdonia sp. Hel_I_63]|jgi:gliding motility-associated protein GldC|uniref:gliding motility protein GldC n=1 Tax=unclassified Dokdonia TaxID=2615033 RepID=UPI00020A78E6|nr:MULTISPECIES: gliding motility protein GldC [unclassified Dokdonia]AEE19862.1 gliding motility-associated protein GldC [Dokdonia sp. 4H-3-7-5]TVZ23920.1 protein involved in gliding motility GldC [Dokdonia sp. Hel_I_63]|tara:strand:- start:76510 stop:76851 length:342 start_codon:yes stop_codon:yes gene_type:complete
MAKKEKSEIKIAIELDENRVPESMAWTARDGGVANEEAKAMLLSLWDPNQKETVRIDLWTKDMPVDEMQQFFHQVLVGMTESFRRATNDEKMADTMKDFADYFAEHLDLEDKK